MPFRKKNKKNYKKYLIYAILIGVIVLMTISFAPTPEMNEIVLFP